MDRGRHLICLCLVFLLLLGACGRRPAPELSPFPSPPPESPAAQSPAPPPRPERPPDEPARQEVGTFEEPIHLTAAPGDARRLFVVERAGRIRVIFDGVIQAEPVLDIAGGVSSGGERGLFALALAPNFSESGLAYVHYTDNNGDTRVVEYRASSRAPMRFDPASSREILFQTQPFANHNGGPLLFDPSGMLILALGDGGSGGDPQNNAQNLRSMLGKLIRIDPLNPSGGKPYGIPQNNPFVGRNDAFPEIWAYGLRNPWRMSFDRETEDLWIGDVGQNRFEEINYVPPPAQSGANYGWPRYEGEAFFKEVAIDESRLVRPIHTYRLDGGRCAVIGGFVYRGLVKTLRGHYLYADFCEGVVKSFRVEGGAAVDHRTLEELRVRQLASFGQDSLGDLYITSLAGQVLRIVRKT